jgi:hypothetical protein
MAIDRHRWGVPVMAATLGAVLAGWVLALSVSDARGATEPAAAERDGQHDFDFEFGTWKAQVRRMVKPLSGSTTWVELSGTSVVRKLWDGEGNVGELDISGPSGRIQGVTVRLYNPRTRQWSVSFSSRAGGTQGQPLYGRFQGGRGEFHDQEILEDRAILVRFVFSDITRDTFRFEQAFSDDGGKRWEVNWIATFQRTPTH